MPKFFKSPEDAWAWAVRRGAYADPLPARNAYEKIKTDEHPETAVEMAALWVAHVEERVAENVKTSNGQGALPF